MYERKSQRLLPKKLFYQRVLKNILLACFIFFLCMIIGVAGFCLTAKASWIDAFHNSALLLSGMGPVLQNYPTVGAKLFSSFYALFGGIVAKAAGQAGTPDGYGGWKSGCCESARPLSPSRP